MNSIQGFGPMQDMMGAMGLGGMRYRNALTDEQKTQVKDILTQYKAESFTESDAKAIFKEFQDSGITPSKGLKETIEAAGFDSEKLRTMGMPEMQGIGRGRQSLALSDDQKSLVQSILDKYDPKNLLASDANAIFKEFQDAGITPGKGLKEAIDAAGFNSEKLISLAMPQDNKKENMFWVMQNSAQSINMFSLQSLKSILNQYDFTNISSDQETSLFSQLMDTGLLKGGSLNIAA
jgi:hypothetical protein